MRGRFDSEVCPRTFLSNMEDDTASESKTESQQENGRKTVFVRNLPYTTNDKKLEDTFSEYGPLKRCFVVKDRGKRRIKKIRHNKLSLFF